QVELVVGGGAEQAEEVVEDLRHEVPGGAGVELEAVAVPPSGASAELGPCLQQGHRRALAGEQRGRGQARDAAADDDGALSGQVAHACAPWVPVSAEAQMRSLTT